VLKIGGGGGTVWGMVPVRPGVRVRKAGLSTVRGVMMAVDGAVEPGAEISVVRAGFRGAIVILSVVICRVAGRGGNKGSGAGVVFDFDRQVFLR
jgi:hypothetical protein